VAVAATGAEEGIFGGQGGRLDPEDGVGICILGRDGGAALALADQRALGGRSVVLALGPVRAGSSTHRGLGLVLVAELLQLGQLVVRGKIGSGRHVDNGGAAAVLVVASV